MKKIICLLAAALLVLTVFPAAAAENTAQPLYYDMGRIGDRNKNLMLSYDICNPISEHYHGRIIGNVFFDTNTAELGLYVKNGDILTPLNEAYGTIIGDDEMNEIVSIINKNKQDNYEPFNRWSVFFDGAQPIETTATEPPEPEVTISPPTEPTTGGWSADSTDDLNAPCLESEPAEDPTENVSDAVEPAEDVTVNPTQTLTQPATQTVTQPLTENPTIIPPFPTQPSTQPPTEPATKDPGSISEQSEDLIVAAAVKAGKSFKLMKKVDTKVVKFKSGNAKIATVSKKGKVTALRKGFATITVRIGKTKRRVYVSVVSSPRLSKKSVTVRRGGYGIVRITGKASNVDNKYGRSKYAKIIAKKSSKKLKIKGLKKGSATLRIRVNGVLLKLKVKIK